MVGCSCQSCKRHCSHVLQLGTLFKLLHCRKCKSFAREIPQSSRISMIQSQLRVQMPKTGYSAVCNTFLTRVCGEVEVAGGCEDGDVILSVLAASCPCKAGRTCVHISATCQAHMYLKNREALMRIKDGKICTSELCKWVWKCCLQQGVSKLLTTRR